MWQKVWNVVTWEYRTGLKIFREYWWFFLIIFFGTIIVRFLIDYNKGGK